MNFESKMRDEMLFICGSLCNRYNGTFTVFTRNFTEKELKEISKKTKPVHIFDCLMGYDISTGNNEKEIYLYPLKVEGKDEAIIIAEIGCLKSEFQLSGNNQKDHEELVKLHDWIEKRRKEALC